MSFAGLSLPADKSVTNEPTDRRTDGRTYPLIESWLTTKNTGGIDVCPARKSEEEFDHSMKRTRLLSSIWKRMSTQSRGARLTMSQKRIAYSKTEPLNAMSNTFIFDPVIFVII